MHLLRSRRFALLLAGEAINGIGSWAALIAMWGFSAYRFHSGPTQIALLVVCWSAPAALLGPWVGVPIDRLGPQRVLVAAYLASAAAAVAMSFAGSLAQLTALATLYGLCKAFSVPACDALPPRVVDDADLLAGNAWLSAAQESALVVGPLVAAAAIAVAGLRAAFLVDAATYLAGVAVVVPLVLRPLPPRPRMALRSELAEGLSLAARTPVVRYVMVLSAAVFVSWSAFAIVEPLYSRDILHRPASQFAWFQVAFGCGLVLTGLALPRLAKVAPVDGPRSVAIAVMVSGLAAGLYVGTRQVAVAFIGVTLWGVSVAFFHAPARTLLQRGVPPYAHGRVLALWRTVHSLCDVTALPLTGLVVAAVGVQPTGLAMGALLSAAGLAGLLVAAKSPAPIQELVSA